MSMQHGEIREKLFSLYDGPLTEKERELVEGHIDSCPDCRQAVSEWRSLAGTLFPQASFSEAEEDRFVSRTLARIASPFQPVRLSWRLALRWLVPLAGSAVAAAWVFFSVLSGAAGSASSNSVGNFLSGDSPDVMSSSWSVVPDSPPMGGVILASYGGGQ